MMHSKLKNWKKTSVSEIMSYIALVVIYYILLTNTHHFLPSLFAAAAAATQTWSRMRTSTILALNAAGVPLPDVAREWLKK